MEGRPRRLPHIDSQRKALCGAIRVDLKSDSYRVRRPLDILQQQSYDIMT